jgi:hypothetical protein
MILALVLFPAFWFVVTEYVCDYTKRKSPGSGGCIDHRIAVSLTPGARFCAVACRTAFRFIINSSDSLHKHIESCIVTLKQLTGTKTHLRQTLPLVSS